MLCWQGLHSKEHEIPENISLQGGTLNKFLIPEQRGARRTLQQTESPAAAPSRGSQQAAASFPGKNYLCSESGWLPQVKRHTQQQEIKYCPGSQSVSLILRAQSTEVCSQGGKREAPLV